jgi:hypothetical protein
LSQRKKEIAFDYRGARSALVGMGIKEDEVDHIVDVANDVAGEVAATLDAAVARRLVDGLCIHPESLCLGVALVAEKFLSLRMQEAGEVGLDAAACVAAVRKFVYMEINDEDDVETPRPETIH